MSALEDRLERECCALASYLVGVQPNSYVRRKYIEAHAEDFVASPSRFDKLLIGVARRSTLGAKLADSYARVFAPQALLRKKLVLLLAILETCAPSFYLIDELDSNSRIVLLLRMSARVAGSLIALVAATPFLFLARLVLAPMDRER